jgi:pimeloyl-ACP methyl ester carboxylesterase
MANPGGPGYTTTGRRELGLFLFGQNLDVHDILGIDNRGRGFSGTIDCQELQHGTAPFGDAEADCAAQLGTSASFYGTGDIAMDSDAVRAALGYDKVDYFGGSYGGEDVTAYATRFGEHLRSIVMGCTPGDTRVEGIYR